MERFDHKGASFGKKMRQFRVSIAVRAGGTIENQ